MPVDAVEVSVAAVWIIQGRHIDLPPFDDPVVRGHNPGNWREEDRIATHECEECMCGAQDLPRDDHPTAYDGGNDTSTENVATAREKDSEIVGGGD